MMYKNGIEEAAVKYKQSCVDICNQIEMKYEKGNKECNLSQNNYFIPYTINYAVADYMLVHNEDWQGNLLVW